MLIRRLRTTKEGFMDDGADNADYLLQNLEDMGINQSIPENRKVLIFLMRRQCVMEKSRVKSY